MLPRLGGVPERPKGSDCKSDVYDFEGSNPSPSTKFSSVSNKLRGYSLVVEPQPSKLMMRVRFPLPAPSFVGCAKYFALVAQLVEHTLGKGEVSGSNPLKSSIAKADMKVSAFVLGAIVHPVFRLQAWMCVAPAVVRCVAMRSRRIAVEIFLSGPHNGRPDFAFRSVAQLAERRSPKP